MVRRGRSRILPHDADCESAIETHSLQPTTELIALLEVPTSKLLVFNQLRILE